MKPGRVGAILRETEGSAMNPSIKTWAVLGAALAVLAAAPASAEVSARTETGFTLTYSRAVSAPPEAIWATVTRPADWWSDAHTYSGSAANIRLDPAPGGCWCEDLPGGGVRHGEIVLAWPDRRMLRVDAPFGPLQALGADAVLTMTWPDPEAGADRELRWTFVVQGQGVGAMADVIDGVIAEQFQRLGDRLNAD